VSGNWTGSDPQLRVLRGLTAAVLLGLLCYAVVVRTDITTIGTLVGALLVDLGFEAGVSWARRPSEDERE
jgi:hypothetical protein